MKKSVKRQRKPSKRRSKDQLSYIPDQFRKLVSGGVSRYLRVLGMNHYRSSVMYKKEDREPTEHVCGEGRVAMEASVDRRYLTVHVHVHPWVISNWKKKWFTDDDINHMVAHEIAHTATQHMYHMAIATFKDEGEMKDAWESLTTIVGRLLHEVDHYRNKKKK